MRQFILQKLKDREQLQLKRSLTLPNSGLVDFCSNDYLGLAAAGVHEVDPDLGATGSRLISGNSNLASDLELTIATFHNQEAALIFSSGYAANVGLFGALGDRSVTILYDELIHASVIDGMRIGHATKYRFRHNDLHHLTEQLQKQEGKVLIAVEAMYSMDGDFCELEKLLDLAQKYGAQVIVDEAHTVGVFGEDGAGRCADLSRHPALLAVVVTYGKAFGYHGAAVLGSGALKEFLVNYARSFIYSTGSSTGMLSAIAGRYTLIKERDGLRAKLLDNIAHYLKVTVGQSDRFSSNKGPVQYYLTENGEMTQHLASHLNAGGMDIRAIQSPTVPKGQERLRICLHSFNTVTQLDQLIELITTF